MDKLERLKNVVVIVDEHTAASNIINQFERLGFKNNIDLGAVCPGKAIGIWSDEICSGKHPHYSTIFFKHEIITYNELVYLVDDYMNDLDKKEDPFEMVEKFFEYYAPSRTEKERNKIIDAFKKRIGAELKTYTPSMSELIEAYARVNDIGVDQVKVLNKDRVKSIGLKHESNR